jgi:hypothetical protein
MTLVTKSEFPLLYPGVTPLTHGIRFIKNTIQNNKK